MAAACGKEVRFGHSIPRPRGINGRRRGRPPFRSPLEGHFVSQATPAAAQNVPLVLPDEPLWHSGKAALVQSLLVVRSAQGVVQAANNCAWFEQLKHVVPDAQGLPQSLTKVVQVPERHVTPACTAGRSSTDPSSILGCPAAHPHAG
jgi:hypothetical protein